MSTGDSIYYYHYYGVLLTDPGVVSYLSNVFANNNTVSSLRLTSHLLMFSLR